MRFYSDIVEGQASVSKAELLTMEDKKKKEEVDPLLSEAMNSLTLEEREEQQEALHGVDGNLVEEPILIENAHVELDNEILRIKHGSMYEAAEVMNRNYVQDRSIRIMYSASQNRYDTKSTAERLLKFF